MSDGKNRWVLVDSHVDDDGDLYDVWKHERTGERVVAPVGDHPSDGFVPTDGGDGDD